MSGVKVSKMNFELNPRGNLWFNDENTFGHKLLAKMGWSKGKGLGKNEDGIKENIKISKRENNTGVGYNRGEIPVAIGCLEYEDILQNLQKHFNKNEARSGADEKFEKSLEQRSRSQRNHLHYQKFVRVKDLNRYSEKDMKSIFLEKPPKPVSDHPSHTPTFKSQLSVNDYFAMKMQKKKEEAAKTAEANVTSEDVQPISERPSKKRKFTSESPENTEGTKKAKKLKHKMSEVPSSMKDIHPTAVSFSEPSVESRPKKKKSSSSEEVSSTKDIHSKPPTEKDSSDSEGQKKKKKSKKRDKLQQQLKSCLKKRAASFDLEGMRNVSFSEQVSFKILDTSLEMCEKMNDLNGNDGPTMDETDFWQESEAHETDDVNNATAEEEDCFKKEEDCLRRDEESSEGGGEDKEVPPCFDLPKCSGPKFDFWLDSQRQATKMKLYKDMAKKIRKDKILCTTNLLDIKGYGNWGLR